VGKTLSTMLANITNWSVGNSMRHDFYNKEKNKNQTPQHKPEMIYTTIDRVDDEVVKQLSSNYKSYYKQPLLYTILHTNYKSIILNCKNFIIDANKESKKSSFDYTILMLIIILMAFGIIIIYSASIGYAVRDFSYANQYYYLVRNVIFVLMGLAAMWLTVMLVNTDILKQYSKHILIFSIISLILVLIPHIGKSLNGSHRWIGFSLINFQPSEFAKLAVSIYFANFVANSKQYLFDLKYLGKAIGIIALVVALLLKEPDMGSSVVVAIIWLSILYLSYCDIKLIFGVAAIAVIFFVDMAAIAPYRMKRVIGFLNPWHDAYGIGYQLSHSLLAYGDGNIFGKGLGNSIEKMFYLPEAHTDFVMSIFAEECGVAGVIIVISIFFILFYKGFIEMANDCKFLNRMFQAYLVQAISVWLITHVCVNIGVGVGILPTKGLTMPFISYGGSALLIDCIAIGILLKVDYENKILRAMKTSF
jgi:cell division protein FtsW